MKMSTLLGSTLALCGMMVAGHAQEKAAGQQTGTALSWDKLVELTDDADGGAIGINSRMDQMVACGKQRAFFKVDGTCMPVPPLGIYDPPEHPTKPTKPTSPTDPTDPTDPKPPVYPPGPGTDDGDGTGGPGTDGHPGTGGKEGCQVNCDGDTGSGTPDPEPVSYRWVLQGAACSGISFKICGSCGPNTAGAACAQFVAGGNVCFTGQSSNHGNAPDKPMMGSYRCLPATTPDYVIPPQAPSSSGGGGNK